MQIDTHKHTYRHLFPPNLKAMISLNLVLNKIWFFFPTAFYNAAWESSTGTLHAGACILVWEFMVIVKSEGRWEEKQDSSMERSSWNQKSGLGVKMWMLCCHPGWGTGPLALFSPLWLYAVIMGMIEKRVRSHPLNPWNVPFSSIEAGARAAE